MNEKPPVFILGGGIAALGIIRSLGRHGIRVYICDSGIRDIAYTSRYVRQIIFPKESNEKSILTLLLDNAVRSVDKPALFPTGDYYLRFVSKYRSELAGGFRFFLSDTTVIETITNKIKFAQFASKHNIPVPNSFIPQNEDELARIKKDLKYPVIIKPALSYCWSKQPDFNKFFPDLKIIKANSAAELDSWWKKLGKYSTELLIQEFIPGSDDQLFHYYSYRSKHGEEILGGLVTQRLRVWPIHGGVGTFIKVTSNQELSGLSRQVLSELNYVGPSSVCYKKDSYTGTYKIFEINGRIPMCHSVFQMCGIDLPYIMYQDLHGNKMPVPELYNLNSKWITISYDIPAVLSYWKAGEITFWKWISSLNGTKMCAEFARDDFKPFLYVVRHIVLVFWRRFIKEGKLFYCLYYRFFQS